VMATTGWSGDPQGTPVKAFSASNAFATPMRSFYSNPGYLPGAWLAGKDMAQGFLPFTQEFAAELGHPVGRIGHIGTEAEYQFYEHGAVFGTTGQPMIMTTGAIYDTWTQIGGVGSDLRYPTSDAYVAGDTVLQEFKGGWMMSDPQAGVLAVREGSSVAMPWLLSDAAMLEPGESLALWTPVVDDLRTLGGDVSQVFKPAEVVNRRSPTGVVQQLQPAHPAPFVYDPDLVKVHPQMGQPREHFEDLVTDETGHGYSFLEIGTSATGTQPRAYWSDQTTNIINEAENRVERLAGGTPLPFQPANWAAEDPLFRRPIRLLLVPQVYNLQTGQPAGAGVTGMNSYRTAPPGGGAVSGWKASRIIQIKQWNDATEREQTIQTLVHELGHSWNIYDPDNRLTGTSSTAWVQNHRQYFNDFMALSGWTVTGKDANGHSTFAHDPNLVYNADLSKSAFASSYAENGAGTPSPNEDWAETFELASRPTIPALSPLLSRKVDLVRSFMSLAVPKVTGHFVELASTLYNKDA